MTKRRIGLWLVGAFGGVGSTLTLGLSALSRGLTEPTGLTTSLPLFDGLDLPAFQDFIVAGHEIRRGSFEKSLEELHHDSKVFDRLWLEECREDLLKASKRVRPGTILGAGPAVERMCDWPEAKRTSTIRQAVDSIAKDLTDFARAESIDHLIVLNVSSTEPPFTPGALHQSWDALKATLGETRSELQLPASSIYALAAIEQGSTYINFTPSLGSSLPALEELAESSGSILAGKDGKTGETLLKTVLAPMFLKRNLKVLSWVGHNVFGNRDGLVLDDPAHKSSKVVSKDKVVSGILGYKPTTLVTIEYIPDMADWKTAWDHIHFEGFLGTKMTLQFTWQGCDSLLAAPLALDLCRLTDLEKRRGSSGLLRYLAPFFKSPEGVEIHDFFEQFDMLADRIDELRRSSPNSPEPTPSH